MKAMRAAIVVAHPDDEVLWLSSALCRSDQVIFCFGAPFQRQQLAAARRLAVAALPLDGLVDLQLPESGAGFAVDWPSPELTAFGVAINDAAARPRYEANYPRLVAALRPLLAQCDVVYTHNPWGEYGHAEHLQVFRAVGALQAEIGFTLWFSNYVSARSWPLAQRLATQNSWVERQELAPDATRARHLMRIYTRSGAWTWTPLHRWPRRETLYACRPGAAAQSFAGEWLLDTGRLRWWPPPWRRPGRKLP